MGNSICEKRGHKYREGLFGGNNCVRCGKERESHEEMSNPGPIGRVEDNSQNGGSGE